MLPTSKSLKLIIMRGKFVFEIMCTDNTLIWKLFNSEKGLCITLVPCTNLVMTCIYTSFILYYNYSYLLSDAFTHLLANIFIAVTDQCIYALLLPTV